MSPTVPPISVMTTSAFGSCGCADDPALDLVGDMRDDLDGAAQEIAAPLLVDDRAVHLAGGHVVELRQVHVDEALVVAEVEVGLRAVVEHVNLAVLIGRHGARIHVEVGVELLNGRPQAAAFEQRAEGCCGDALAREN